nr:MAG TPA: hypothetical protein [Caudoviricetes sp.]DAZ75665.1 MAG TPA: hypothetical protein [Caudoviricetes sp.]
MNNILKECLLWQTDIRRQEDMMVSTAILP